MESFLHSPPPVLVRVCTSRHGYLLGLAGVKDLVQDAFVNVLNGAHTFDHAQPCEAFDQQLKCRGWLVTIAQNLVRDHYRGQPEISLVDDADLERLAGASDGNPGRSRLLRRPTQIAKIWFLFIV